MATNPKLAGKTSRLPSSKAREPDAASAKGRQIFRPRLHMAGAASPFSVTETGYIRIDLGEDAGEMARVIEKALETVDKEQYRTLARGLDLLGLRIQREKALRDEQMQRLVDALATNTHKVDATQARMRAKAVELVMNGTSWLTATELFSELPKKPSNVHTTLARWLEQGRIFALEKNGVRIFPRYAFDAMLEPVPLLKEALKVLAGRSPFQIASWFESPSNYLNGKRPREVLELDGLAVVKAAQRLVEGAVHG